MLSRTVRRSWTLLLFLVAVLVALLVIASGANAVSCPSGTDVYTPSSGTSGDWSVAGNWSFGIPTSTTIACWPTTDTVTISSANATAAAVQGGTLTISNGESLTIGNSSDDSSLVNLTMAGSLSGDSPLTLTGNFSWDGQGELGGSGSNGVAITQTGGGTFSISGSGQNYFEGGSIQTSSNVSISDLNFIAADSPSLSTTGVVTFAPGTYTQNGGASLSISAEGYDTTGATVLENYGLSVNPGGSSSLGGNLSTPGLNVASGASISVPSGVTLSSGGGTVSGTVTGAGTFDVTGGTQTIASSGAVSTSQVGVSGGTLDAAAGSTYAAAGGTTVDGGNLEMFANGSSTGSLTLSGGSIYGDGTFGVTGAFNWTGQATLGGSGSNGVAITQSGGAPSTISGSGQNYFEGGSIQSTSSYTISDLNFIAADSPSLSTTGVVTFAPGTYSANGGASLDISAKGFDISGNTTLPNYAVTQTGGTTDIPGADTFTPGAPFALQSGTLQVDGELGAGVTLTGGTLSGTGEVSGSVTNTAGTVAPGDAPGTLTVDGSYTQGAGGTLQIAQDGTASGDVSLLYVDDTVSLGGTLAMEPTVAYAGSASPGDEVPVMTYVSGNLSGTFANVTSTPPLQDSESYSVELPPGDVFSNVDVLVGGAAAPVNNTPPTVSGTATQGQQLSVTNGSWSNNPTSFTYQWEDCTTSAGAGCTLISGATSSTYTLQSTDVGKYVTAVVTAHNSSDTPVPEPASNTIGPIAALPPANITAPTVSGTATQGQQLSVSTGTWTNNPTSFTYQWLDCSTASESNCVPIQGATSSTYTLQSTDVGLYVTAIVTAHNAAASPGQQTASNTIGPIAALPTAPADTVPPSLTGTPLPGDKLTCNPGTWTGSPTFSYSWQLNGNGIAGQTAPTLVVTILDEGGSITCQVTATDAAGSTTWSSPGTIVAAAGTLTCPKPTGTVTSTAVGPLRLGETKAAARKSLPRYHQIGFGFDNFCLYGGWGIRGAYIKNRFAILLTANPYYSVHGVTPGMTVAYAKTHLKLGKLIVIGTSDWYITKGSGQSNIVLYVAGSLVRGIGIAYKADTATYSEQKKFLHVFYGP